jgi:hypothetical protein
MVSNVPLSSHSFTLEVWVRFPQTLQQIIAFSGGINVAHECVFLGLGDTTLGQWYTGFVGDDLDTPTGHWSEANAWHFLTVTFNTTFRSLVLYRDAVVLASGTTSAQVATGSPYSLNIGAQCDQMPAARGWCVAPHARALHTGSAALRSRSIGSLVCRACRACARALRVRQAGRPR